MNLKQLSISLLCATLLLTGCTKTNNNTNTIIPTVATSYASSITVNYSTFDLDDSIQNATSINLNEYNEDVLINSAGTYLLEGTLKDGQILIEVQASDKVKLILKDVTINSSTTSPIEVVEADKVTITLAPNTNNIINDNRILNENEEGSGAAIYSTSSLTINGSGKLEVNANYHNGIATKKNLKVVSGDIIINAQNNGLKGNNSVVIKDGNISITANNDAIKTEEEEDSEKGYVLIEKGNININSVEDGISASQYAVILGGNINITTTAEVEPSGSDDNQFTDAMFPGNFDPSKFQDDNFDENFDPSKFEGFRPEQGQMTPPTDGQMPQIPEGELPSFNQNTEGQQMPTNNRPNRIDRNQGNEQFSPNNDNPQTFPNQNTTNENTDEEVIEETNDISAKGIKAGKELYIANGNIAINSTDHALKSSGLIEIMNGTLTLNSSLCKGITAEENLTIANGIINIENAYEGIESKNGIITINGGNISIYANDDGLNASSQTMSDIVVNGGTLYVHATGDGIDSNRNITLNGGNVTVISSNSGPETALDCDGTLSITGGNVSAYGYNTMLKTPQGDTQKVVSLTFDSTISKDSTIEIADEKNNTVLSFIAEENFINIQFTNSKLDNGKYTVYVNDEINTTFEITDTVTTIGNGGGMFPGGGRFNRPTDNQNFQPESQSK